MTVTQHIFSRDLIGDCFADCQLLFSAAAASSRAISAAAATFQHAWLSTSLVPVAGPSRCFWSELRQPTWVPHHLHVLRLLSLLQQVRLSLLTPQVCPQYLSCLYRFLWCFWAQECCCCLQAAGLLLIWPNAQSSRIREAAGAGQEGHASPMRKTDSHQSLGPPDWHCRHCITLRTPLPCSFMPLPESLMLPSSHRLACLGPMCMLPDH